MNWGWLLLRMAIGLTILTTMVMSQVFWYRVTWRVTSRWPSLTMRVAARVVYILSVTLVALAFANGLREGRHGHLAPRDAMLTIFAGLWFTSTFFAYLSVKFVHGIDWVWNLLRRAVHSSGQRVCAKPEASAALQQKSHPAPVELLADPSRRYFFRTATALAGAAPFLTAVYGFAAERLNYQVRRVEIPLPNLPTALDGMRIMQISDIHLSGYMTRTEVRRAVDMANDLGADLAVVTGDFITGSSDPIADCIEEVSRLHAPLGVWGCNGNHEIYARAESTAQELFAQFGMTLLRRESAILEFRGAKFNLMGVDYQRERNNTGHKTPMLAGLETLIRRDMPNILMSHNPNTFDRAAELGVELSLAGHTHGGQVQVEILDHRLSPARFISDYVAGLYTRPMFAPAEDSPRHSGSHAARALPNREPVDATARHAAIYVNRGLGTVGAPVRLGVPPEISLLVLRSA